MILSIITESDDDYDFLKGRGFLKMMVNNSEVYCLMIIIDDMI